MKLIVSVPSQYGSPVLKSLSPQLVSVQSARRFFLFAFWIPGQHHGTKPRDSHLRFLKPPALIFSSSFFVFLVLLPPFSRFFLPFKTSGAVHFSPLTFSHWWAHMSRSLNLNSLEPIGE
ncbi:uncharacterized protein TNCV_1278571 [Trichonephila clavipes]|nr:uncharacterized protein TNCV_1278571 [Trichonephila clavipes]